MKQKIKNALMPNFFSLDICFSVNSEASNIKIYSPITRNPSASTKAPFGREATPIAALAG